MPQEKAKYFLDQQACLKQMCNLKIEYRSEYGCGERFMVQDKQRPIVQMETAWENRIGKKWNIEFKGHLQPIRSLLAVEDLN